MLHISIFDAVLISIIMGGLTTGLMMWMYWQGRMDQFAVGETQGEWEARMDSACDYWEGRLGQGMAKDEGEQWAHQAITGGVWLTEGVYDTRGEALDAHLACYLTHGGRVETRVVPLVEVMWNQG